MQSCRHRRPAPGLRALRESQVRRAVPPVLRSQLADCEAKVAKAQAPRRAWESRDVRRDVRESQLRHGPCFAWGDFGACGIARTAGRVPVRDDRWVRRSPVAGVWMGPRNLHGIRTIGAEIATTRPAPVVGVSESLGLLGRNGTRPALCLRAAKPAGRSRKTRAARESRLDARLGRSGVAGAYREFSNHELNLTSWRDARVPESGGELETARVASAIGPSQVNSAVSRLRTVASTG